MNLALLPPPPPVPPTEQYNIILPRGLSPTGYRLNDLHRGRDPIWVRTSWISHSHLTVSCKFQGVQYIPDWNVLFIPSSEYLTSKLKEEAYTVGMDLFKILGPTIIKPRIWIDSVGIILKVFSDSENMRPLPLYLIAIGDRWYGVSVGFNLRIMAINKKNAHTYNSWKLSHLWQLNCVRPNGTTLHYLLLSQEMLCR